MGNKIWFPLWTNYIKFKKLEYLSKIISEHNLEQLKKFLGSFNSDQCKELLNNQCNENGSTLLMFACVYGNSQIVKSLLKYGADASLVDKKGQTALFYLINSSIDNKKEVVCSLVESKCPLDVRDNQNSTCLIEAVKLDQTELVKILLEQGVDVNKSDLEGVCALHRAVDNGNLEITQMLVKTKNCDINKADLSYGWTALHVAAMHNDMEIVKILLYRGAALNARDLSWQTPLTFAQQNKSYEVARFLRNHGAIDSKTNCSPRKLSLLMKKCHNFNIREY